VVDQPVYPVLGDAQRLQQIVWNLLSNAIKFSRGGGDVEIKLSQIEASAYITVSDNGDGIPTEFLPRIFDRFSQADSSTTRKYGGLGLGLAIVQQLVDLHGGTVRAYSAGENHGAKFSVAVPCMANRAESPAEVQPSDNGKRGPEGATTLTGLRILIVDDDSDSREALAALLMLRAAEVRSVATVREALEVLTDWQPHVLISDIGMPDEDGYDLIREVRALEAGNGRHIPAIALTGYAAVEDGERALSAGYQMHIGKPIEADHLVRVIANFGWQSAGESRPS
jgi:CheY-like chemotaxis protein